MRRELAPPKGGTKRSDLLFWLLLVSLLVGFALWQWAPARAFAWKYDEGVEAIKANLMARGHRLYEEIWSDQPPLFSLLLVGVFRLFGETVSVARVLVLGLAIVGLGSLAVLGRCLTSRLGALAAVTLTLLLPHFQAMSIMVLISLPAVSLALVAMAAAGLYQHRQETRWLVVSGTLFSLSLLVKPVAALLYLPLTFIVCWGLDDGTPRPRRRLRTWFMFNAIAAAPVLLALLYFGPRSFFDQVVGTLVGARGAHDYSLAANAAKVGDYLLADNWGLAYIGVLCLAAAGLASLGARRAWRSCGFLILWLAGVVVSLLIQTPIRRHELFLVMPPLAIAAGVGLQEALLRLRGIRRASLAGQVATVALLGCVALVVRDLAGMVPQDLTLRSTSLGERDQDPARRDVLLYIASETPPDSLIITDDPMLAFKSHRRIPPELAVPSYRRVEAGELTADLLTRLTEERSPAAVVLWDGRLERVTDYARWLRQTYCTARAYGDARWLFVPCGSTLEDLASTDEGIVFRGSTIQRYAVERGGTIHLTLFWRAGQALDKDYTLFVQLLDVEGNPWGQADLRPLDEQHLTSDWHVGETIAQEVGLPVMPDAPAGEKTIVVGFYDLKTSERRSRMYDAQGKQLPGNQVSLKPRPVVRWEGQFAVPDPQHILQARLGDGLQLLGYDLVDPYLEPGAKIGLELYWLATAEMRTSYTVFLHLVDQSGETIAQSDQIPGEGRYPTTGWLPGEVIVDTHEIALPGDLQPGPYRLIFGMYDLATGARLPLARDGEVEGNSAELTVLHSR